MVAQCLLDTNSIIDFLNGRLPENGKNFIADIEPAISVISHIELLSNKNVPEKEWNQLQRFMQLAIIYALDSQIVEQTITLRQNHKLKHLMPLLPLLLSLTNLHSSPEICLI